MDDKSIGLGVAERLSYLQPNEQNIVYRLLKEEVKVDIQQAEELKRQSLDHELGEDEIRKIVIPKAPVAKKKSIRLREDLFAKYFTEEQTQEEIEETIAKALEHYQSKS